MRILNKHRDKIPSSAVYIGRGSKWGNPFVIGKDGSRALVLEKYRQYIMNKKELLEALGELKGKDLACYCHPLPCHGDILKELVDRTIASIDELECEDLKKFCSWEGPAVTAGPNGPIMCEGCFCEEAYKNWYEEHAVYCDVCHLTVDKDNGEYHTDGEEETGVAYTLFVCNNCEQDRLDEMEE